MKMGVGIKISISAVVVRKDGRREDLGKIVEKASGSARNR